MRAAPRWLLLPVAAGLAVFFLWPMALALQEATRAGDAWRWLAGDYARGRIAGALLQAALSLGLAAAVAAPLAVLHHRWRIPGSGALLALQAGVFVLPVFVVVGGLRETVGHGGWLHAATGLDLLAPAGPGGIPWGVPIANAYYNAGLLALLLHGALERRPRALEDAAATLGASPAQAFARAVWPLLRPAIAAAGLLVLLFCLASFGVVFLLGAGRVDTLDTLLHANLRGGFPREDRAAVLATVQLALQATLLLAVLALQWRAARLPPAPARAAPPAPAWATSLAVGVAVASMLPLAAVLVGSLQVGGQWSLDAWRALAGGPGHLQGFDLSRAIGLSLGYAAASVLLAVLATAALGYAARGRTGRFVEALAFLPLGTSSVVLGFAFLLAFTGRTWLPLVGSPWGIVAAHTLIALPFVARALLPALHALDLRLDAAAASLGASLPARVRRVHLPLLRGPLATACAFAAALSLGDYGASLLLMTDGTMSLAVWIGRHGGIGSFDPLARAQSTALAALLLLLTLAVFLVAAVARPRRRGSP